MLIPKTTHMMIDCETLGLQAGCPVLSIGAVAFSEDGYWSQSYVTLSLLDQLRLGARPEQETLDWWAHQPTEAWQHLQTPPPVPVETALDQLARHWEESTAELVWACGPMADVVWLEWWYRRLKLTPPWSYRQVRDHRTIMDLAQIDDDERTRPEIPHHALHDAIAQALDARSAMRRLRSARNLFTSRAGDQLEAEGYEEKEPAPVGPANGLISPGTYDVIEPPAGGHPV